MGIWKDKQELEQKIAVWKAAFEACAVGQSYDVGDRKLTNADLPEIRKTLNYLRRELAEFEVGTGPFFLPGRPKK